jgi:hypothetical protein
MGLSSVLGSNCDILEHVPFKDYVRFQLLVAITLVDSLGFKKVRTNRDKLRRSRERPGTD